MSDLRYIIDDVHSDYTEILKNLFKNQNFITKNLKDYSNLSFLEKNDCLVVSLSSAIDNKNLFSNLENKIIYFTANTFSNDTYNYYAQKSNFKGYICSSIENQNLLNHLNVNNFFAPNIYPNLKDVINLNFNQDKVSTLINRYKSISELFKINNLTSYYSFEQIKENYHNLQLYDMSTSQSAKDIDVLKDSKYCLHIKYWGHVCNAPLKSLALGVPVIMDATTYQIGCYSYYIQNGFNGIIARDYYDIISLLNNKHYDNLYRKLKINCINFRNKLIDNYSDLFYNNFNKFLNE